MVVDQRVGFVLSIEHHLPGFQPGLRGSDGIDSEAIGRCTGRFAQDVVERWEECPVLSDLESCAAVGEVERHGRCAAGSIKVNVVAVGRLNVDVVAIALQPDVVGGIVGSRLGGGHLHEEWVAMLVVLHIFLRSVVDVASDIGRVGIVGLALNAVPSCLQVGFRCDRVVLGQCDEYDGETT